MSLSPRPKWKTPPKPAVYAENHLIEAILDGHFPIDSTLPAERELATQLGVTRPTLREALQRLARDGWIEIRHGRQTRVRNYWHEGNLGVLGSIVRQSEKLPEDFVANLLAVRQLMAPAYIRLAVEKAPEKVIKVLQACENLPDSAQEYASADWEVHHQCTIACGNPIFTLILNGFADFYQTMANIYFQQQASRLHSQNFYQELLEVANKHDGERAEAVAQRVMSESLRLWQAAIHKS